MWKYQERIRRRHAYAGIVCLLISGITFFSATEPEIAARVCALFPETPAGRRAAVFMLDRELDRSLAVYRAEDATQRHLVGNFETLGAATTGWPVRRSNAGVSRGEEDAHPRTPGRAASARGQGRG